MRRPSRFVSWVLTDILGALVFAWGVSLVISRPSAYSISLWGLMGSARMIVGLTQIVAGVMLLTPRSAWWGATIIDVLMAIAVGVYLWIGEPAQAAVHGAILTWALVVTCIRHPAWAAKARLQAAAEWVAEHEIADQNRHEPAQKNRPMVRPT